MLLIFAAFKDGGVSIGSLKDPSGITVLQDPHGGDFYSSLLYLFISFAV